MSKSAAGIREGIREDGTVEGCFIETHWLPLDYATLVPGDEDGYFRFVGDGSGINYEIRVPIKSILKVLAQAIL